MRTKNFLFKKTTMLLGCCLMASIAVAQTPFTNRQIKKTFSKTNHANPISVLHGKVNGTQTTLSAKSLIQPDWNKRITDTSNYPTVKFGGLHRDTQGNYVYVATNGNPGGTYKAVIVKTQNNGVELWRREFSSAYFTAGSKVVTDSQDNIFVLGEVIRDSVNRESYLTKYTSSGNVVWTKYYSQTDFQLVKGMELLADSQDNIIAISQINGDNGLSNQYYLIQKFEQSGNILWEQEISYPTTNITYNKMNFNTYIKSTLLSDNSVVMFDRSFYLKLNSNGEIDWNNSLTTNVLISADERNDTIVTFTKSQYEMYVTKLTSDNINVWNNTLNVTYSHRPGDICINEKNNIFVMMQADFDVGTHGPEVIKLSSNGVVQYDNNYPCDNIDNEIKDGFSYYIKANEHDSVIIGGMGQDFILTAVAIDSLGNLIAGNEFNTFEPGYDYIYAYDGFNYYDGKMIVGGNQRNLSESGYDLFVTAIDFNANVKWTQFVKKEATSDLEVYEAALDASNNTYLAGSGKAGPWYRSFNVIKQNDDGAVVWNKIYSLDGYAAAVKVLSDSSIIVGGAFSWSPALINIKPDGTVKWQLTLSNLSFTMGGIQFINIDNDGNIIAASQASNNGLHLIYITKVSPNGTLIWEYTNNTTTGTDIYHLTTDINNNIIFSGIEITSDGNITYAAKLNSNGQLVWEYRESYSGTDLISQTYGDNEGNTYLVGQASDQGLFIKLDPLGQKVLSNQTTDAGYYYGIFGKEGVVYAAGTTLNSLGTIQSELVARNAAGTILWSQNIAEAGKAIYGQYIIGDENYLYMSGYSIDTLSNQYSIMAIYDYQGNLKYNSEIKVSREEGDYDNFMLADFAQNSNHLVIAILSSVIEPNTNVNEYNLAVIGNSIRYTKPVVVSIEEKNIVASTFKCYPNPVTDILYLSDDKTISSVTIYNITDQAVISKSIHATKASLNVSGLTSGIYTVKVESNENVESFKIIKK